MSCWGGYFNASLGRGDCPSQGLCPALGAAQVIDVNTLRPIVFDHVVAGGYKTCGMSQGTLLCWGQQELGTITADGGEPDPAYATPVNF